MAGAWLSDFSRTCRLPDFDLEKHIEQLRKGNGNKGPAVGSGEQGSRGVALEGGSQPP